MNVDCKVYANDTALAVAVSECC